MYGDNLSWNLDESIYKLIGNVRFENSDVIIDGGTALAMGNYYFTDPQGAEVKVEYTFGYIEDGNAKLRIQLHHSSMPAK